MTITLPDNPYLLTNAGNVLRWSNEFTSAELCLNKSLALNLACAEAWLNRGMLDEDLGRWPEAYTCYQNAYSLKPDQPVIALALAYQRMRLGEWGNEPWLPVGAPEGIKAFPSTWSLWEDGRCDYGILPNIPVWRGQDLTGDRLLITPEGGFGDYIWLSRYLPKLAEMVGRDGCVRILVPDPLLRLANERFPLFRVIPWPVSGISELRPSTFNYQIPLLSLLTRFLRDPRNIPPVCLKLSNP